MPAPVVYEHCGLRLRSEVELHLPRVSEAVWDVDVRWGPDIDDSDAPPPGEVLAAYGSGEDRWYTATATESGYLLRFRDCGELVVSADLDEVLVRRDPSGRADLLPVLLAGTGTAFLLALLGKTVLHASAVAVQGSALAFVGESGQGKSTLAALLCTAGAELITDDVLVVDGGPPVTCTGGASEIRLRSSASAIVDSRPDLATRTTADERLAFAPRCAPPRPHGLACIVVPVPSRTATDVGVRALPPSTALFTLLGSPRVHGWRRPDVIGRDFTTLSRVVNDVPVFEVTIPWGPPFGPRVAQSLARLVTPEGEPAPWEGRR